MSLPMNVQPVKDPSKLEQDDIVIAFMGPTGSGKSHLIDVLTGEPGKRAHSGLKSHTSEISATRIQNHEQYGDRIVLVDTPGFDGTNRSDIESLLLISAWLEDTYKQRITLTGIVYSQRISDNRLPCVPQRNLRMFSKLCGDPAAKSIVFVTTMWDRPQKTESNESREKELSDNFWNVMIHNGATVARFDNKSQSAWNIVYHIITKNSEKKALLLQDEIFKQKKPLSETKAVKELYTDLQIVLSNHKDCLLAEQAKAQGDPARIAALKEEYEHIQTQFEKTFDDDHKLLHVSLLRKFNFLFERRHRGKRGAI